MNNFLSMGAFDALRNVRLQLRKTGDDDRLEAVKILRSISADVASLDFQSALELDSIVSSDAPVDTPHIFYRHCLFDVIVSLKEGWARSITLGRGKFLRQLERDEHQCFRASRLNEDPPAPDVVDWWDSLAATMRQTYDRDRMNRARRAEWLSFQHEESRLVTLGISLKPRWIAIDDNTAGYDLLSFDQTTGVNPKNRLIEVKSTIASPLRFFITRNEWEQAKKFGDAYWFHIWDLSVDPPRLFVRSGAQVTGHIPADQGNGRWATAEIRVGSDALLP